MTAADQVAKWPPSYLRRMIWRHFDIMRRRGLLPSAGPQGAQVRLIEWAIAIDQECAKRRAQRILERARLN